MGWNHLEHHHRPEEDISLNGYLDLLSKAGDTLIRNGMRFTTMKRRDVSYFRKRRLDRAHPPRS
jgi:hypothetical protein